MNRLTRFCGSLVAVALVLAAARPVTAQAEAWPAQALPEQAAHKQVISANPFGLLLDLFNGEYERAVSGSATAGVGGSYFGKASEDYVNADVFYRYYPDGRPFEGWAFGGKLGITNVAGGTYFGYGFDVNHSWLMGREKKFYVGVGFGLKRLVAVPDGKDILGYIPTVRIINIGFAF